MGKATPKAQRALSAEARPHSLCESVSGRVFAQTMLGSCRTDFSGPPRCDRMVGRSVPDMSYQYDSIFLAVGRELLY